MARYLLSGGAGFIGSHLSDALLADGHEITILDDFSTGSAKNIPDDDAVTLIEHDVTEPLPVNPTFDVVIHLASVPTPAEYMNRPIDTLRTGSTATERTLSVAAASDATYLFASSSEVYGNPIEHPQPESYNGDVDPYGPRACYDEGKRYGEALVRAYQQEHGVDARIARIFNTYGPRMRDDRVIPAFIQQAIAEDPLTVHGDGTQTRSFCYIDDLVRGLRALLRSDYTKPINLGNPDELSVTDLAGVILDVTDSNSRLVHTKRPPDDPDKRQPDITRAREKLDWSPNVTLRDGIQKTVGWYCS